MTTGRINQVAFLRDVRPACSSTHYLGRGEAITGQDHRSCRGTKCTSYERPGPRPYAHEIFRIQKHDRASMHRRGRIMPIDTLGTSSTTEVHQAATRINQVAFLRDVRPACSSTHYLGRGEAITGQDHRSCRGTKCTSYERPGPRPYAHEIFRIQKHDRASMHRRGRIMPIDTLGTSSTTEVHQAATRSLDEEG
ncbi:hypothetical protein V6N13_022371 [Hibiscus sabdariffa]